jgi:hypothetical protein
MEAKNYHDHDGWTITSSSLREFLRSPSLYYHRYVLRDAVIPENRSLIIGSAFHCLVLEPDQFEQRYYMGNYQQSDPNGRVRLTPYEWSNVKLFAERLKAHIFYGSHLKDAIKEKPLAVKLSNGLIIKAKPDALHKGMIIDVKSTGHLKNAFNSKVLEFGYHIQAAFYDGVLHRSGDEDNRDFVFFVLCKRKPYSVFLKKIPHHTLKKIWNDQVLPTLDRIHKCLVDNEWGDVISCKN